MAKEKVDMGKFPETRIEGMRKAYGARGKSVPLRYEVAADKAIKSRRSTSDGYMPRKLEVKHRGESMGFDKKPKIWQKGSVQKPVSENVMNMKGYDKAKRATENRKPINPDNIPW